MSKRHHKKSGTAARRTKRRKGTGLGGSLEGVTTGTMGSITGAFKSAVGGGGQGKPSALSLGLALLILLALGGLAAWQLSR
jgi:hypothetical protein